MRKILFVITEDKFYLILKLDKKFVSFFVNHCRRRCACVCMCRSAVLYVVKLLWIRLRTHRRVCVSSSTSMFLLRECMEHLQTAAAAVTIKSFKCKFLHIYICTVYLAFYRCGKTVCSGENFGW